MGACASTNADADQEAAQDEHEQKGDKPSSPRKDKDGDFDFRETLRGVTCAVLDRLATTLEYEGELYQEIAIRAGRSHFMDLMGPQFFEKVFSTYLYLKTVREPDVERSNLAYEHQRYSNFISSALASPFRTPAPSRKEFAKKMQDAARKTQETLKSSAAQTTNADLKQHLDFFIRVFDFLQGDIAAEGSQLLYSNIDKICDSEP